MRIRQINLWIFIYYYYLKKEMEDNKIEQLRSKLEEYGQDHLISHIEFLNESEKKLQYLEKLETIDFKLINSLFKTFQNSQIGEQNQQTSRDITPIKSSYSKSDFSEQEFKEITNIGLNSISEGKIALLILAGGQGSRLGYEKPKGTYNLRMPSGKTLFQYLVERFISVQNLSKSLTNSNNKEYGNLLIMTSVENDKDTQNFFEEHNYFNYPKNKIIFFPQDTIPAINLEGKILNKNSLEIFENPNGNGGCFIALKKHKVIEKIKENGVQYLQVISIDNPLSKISDPFFVGLCIKNSIEISARTLPKRDASEPVGVFVNEGSKANLIDYGEFPKDLAKLTDENGQLVFRHSNILNYIVSVDFLERTIVNQEKYEKLITLFNFAKKKIESFDLKELKETKVDGIKFELFFHTIFIFAEKEMLLFEGERSEEFAPVKNPESFENDTPKTSRDYMSNLFKKWGKKVGIEFGNENEYFEISFLKSYDGENLEDLKNSRFELPQYISN